MKNGIVSKISFKNEPVLKYLPGSAERIELEAALSEISSQCPEIPLIIGGKEVRTGKMGECTLPHNHKKVIGTFHKAGSNEIHMAIESALQAKAEWDKLPWESRAAVFLRAADLAAGSYRAMLNAATMLNQSKTYRQAEIDSACELIDFLRFNASCLPEIYSDQPISTGSVWNRVEYRPLEGFVLAISPFNFTAIGSNLIGSPAIAGNVVLWKPASTAVYSSYIVFKLFQEAGVPAGVMNFIPGDSQDISNAALLDENLCGIHFTGSTSTFQNIYATVGNHISTYKTYPRIVGETGGKNFVVAHPSAQVERLSRCLMEGAFEYQGQKCSAASRAYIPNEIWPALKDSLLDKVKNIKVGDVEDISTFMGAVIDKKSFDSICNYIDYAKDAPDAKILFGGSYDDSVGYFVQPTIILTSNPKFRTMEEEIFGPVLTIYLYDGEDFEEILELCNQTSKYGLTGSIFATDRFAIQLAEEKLTYAAGNFYINDRPTGAVVGQQPFGGSRASGTNDKAGSKLNLLRWMSPISIKETL